MCPRPSPRGGGSRERLAWGLAVARRGGRRRGARGSLARTRRPTRAALARFAVTAPAGGTIATDAVQVVISPDGRRLVFAIVDSAGTPRLWIRPLDSFSAQPLPGTENAFLPFWSPDSRFIAFFAEGKLRKVPVGGGPPEVICDAPNGRGGSWSKDGVIVFAPLAMGPLLRVSADGGEPTEVARPDSGRHETGLRFPCFLPDGRHFLYVGLPRRQADFDVYLGTLGSKEHRRIMAAGSAPVYAEPGYLLFARGGRLVAQRFDRFRSRPAGKAVPIGDVAPLSNFEGAPLLSASANGVLVHAETSLPNTRLVWLDRAGRPSGTVPLPPGCYAFPSLSPDDQRVAVDETQFRDQRRHLDGRSAARRRHAADLRRPGLRRGSPGSGRPTAAGSPSSTTGRAPMTSTRCAPVAREGRSRSSNPAWSSSSPRRSRRTGEYLVFAQNDEATGWDLWLLPLEGDRKPVPYLRTPFNEISADISPDGRWLAYDSDETGSPEIYVRSFPEPGEKYRVSTSGGTAARVVEGRPGVARLDRRRSFLLTNGSVFSVDVETTPSFRAGTPRLLFTPRQDIAGIAATRDLKRFLAAVPVEGAAPPSITVMLNWQAALKR